MKAAVIDNRVNRVDIDNREIIELTEAAGYDVAVYFEVELDPPHTRQYLPEGKMETFKLLVEEHGPIDKVIIAQPLRSHQFGTIKELLDIEVIDKPMLVLEIFEKKANSIDIKLQIQLAQLKYTLPQMVSEVGQNVQSERAGFMAGGEQITDVVASDIRSRMRSIEAKIREQKTQLKIQTEEVPRLPIVGYYSAGKSTLFNMLTTSARDTGAEAFTTMIMKTQRSKVAGYPIDLVDTVGLVDLPANILSAFELMLSQVFSYSGMILCLNSSLPFEHWKTRLADFEDYLERFTGTTRPRVIVALAKADLANQVSLEQMRHHLDGLDWLGDKQVITTRSDRPEETRKAFVEAFERIFDDYLTQFFYQNLSPSTASKIHNIARVEDQQWNNDGTTSMAGVGPTNLLDELKGEIFS